MMSLSSARLTSIFRRPNPMRSGRLGWEPIATLCLTASSTVLRMTWGSPPWKPHATLAEVMKGMMATSAPSVQRFPPLRLALEHVAQRFDEAVRVRVGHGQRAGPEAALREQHALVEQPHEHARRRLGIRGATRAIVAEPCLRPVQAEERPHAGHLAGPLELAQEPGHPAANALTESVEPCIGLGGELLHGGHTARHRQRVGIEGAAVTDSTLAAARVIVVHHLGAPAESAHGEAPADDLAERGEVGTNAEALLRSPRPHAEGDHLVEDQQNTQAGRHLAQPLEEALARRQDPADAQGGIDEERGDVRAVPFENLGAGLGVVPRQDHDVLEHCRRYPRRRGHGFRPLARAGLFEIGRDADQDPVVGAVIGALELGDLAPPREGPRHPHRVHRRLGAGIGEADGLHAGDALRQDLGQAHLVLARTRKGHAPARRVLDGLDDGRVGVAQDQARVIAVEVQSLDAVGVPDARAFSPRDIERIRIEEDRRAAVAARHHTERFLVELARACALSLVVVDRVFEGHGLSFPPHPAPSPLWGEGGMRGYSTVDSSRSRRARSSAWASATVTLRNRSRWPGLTWPMRPMSNEHTVAILVYPPVDCRSTRSTMGCPSPITWIPPSATPSEMMSCPSVCSMKGPLSRAPMRSLWGSIS